jgi:hypothetical protein
VRLNVETHGVRLNVETHGVRLLLRGIGRKWETKHGWNSPLTHSASKKEITHRRIKCLAKFIEGKYENPEYSS